MLVPVITARAPWLKPGGIMIPQSVTAWTASVHDSHLEDMMTFLQANPYGLVLGDLVYKTVTKTLDPQLPSPRRW